MKDKATGAIVEYTTHIRDYDYEVVCGAAEGTYPEEYEIPRENTGTIIDQKVNDCVAAVIVQLAESFYGEEMSEGYTYGEFRNDSMKKAQRGGMSISSAMDFWVSLGTLPKKYFDIIAEMPEMSQITAKFPEFKELSSRYKLKGYVTINYNKQKKDLAIKDALTKYKRGLLTSARDYFPGGSHCILLTGWNDKNGTYKFKNSWGEDYGDKGFSEIPKDEIDPCYLPLFEGLDLPFTDVSPDRWSFKHIRNVFFSGMMNGKSKDIFDPTGYVTREELAAVLDRRDEKVDERFDIFNRVLEEKFREEQK